MQDFFFFFFLFRSRGNLTCQKNCALSVTTGANELLSFSRRCLRIYSNSTVDRLPLLKLNKRIKAIFRDKNNSVIHDSVKP